MIGPEIHWVVPVRPSVPREVHEGSEHSVAGVAIGGRNFKPAVGNAVVNHQESAWPNLGHIAQRVLISLKAPLMRPVLSLPVDIETDQKIDQAGDQNEHAIAQTVNPEAATPA